MQLLVCRMLHQHMALRKRGFALASVLLFAMVFSPAHCIKVRVWTNVTDSDFIYPEIDPASDYSIDSLMEKPSLGIAISGGGWRAASLAYGWLRALHLVSYGYSIMSHLAAEMQNLRLL